MKIREITDEAIVFDNGNTITFDHDQDCCECNFAHFKAIDEPGIYKEEFGSNLRFESIPCSGFRFGSNPLRMYFVPCYSYQNGYYSDDIDIYYNGVQVLNFDCEVEE